MKVPAPGEPELPDTFLRPRYRSTQPIFFVKENHELFSSFLGSFAAKQAEKGQTMQRFIPYFNYG